MKSRWGSFLMWAAILVGILIWNGLKDDPTRRMEIQVDAMDSRIKDLQGRVLELEAARGR